MNAKSEVITNEEYVESLKKIQLEKIADGT